MAGKIFKEGGVVLERRKQLGGEDQEKKGTPVAMAKYCVGVFKSVSTIDWTSYLGALVRYLVKKKRLAKSFEKDRKAVVKTICSNIVLGSVSGDSWMRAFESCERDARSRKACW